MRKYIVLIVYISSLTMLKGSSAFEFGSRDKVYLEKDSSEVDVLNKNKDLNSPESQSTFTFESVDKLIQTTYFDPIEDNLEDIQAKAIAYDGNPKVKQAREAIKNLDPSRMIDLLSGSELLKLPLGISREVNGYKYSIVFERAKIYPEYAELTVYAGIEKANEMGLFFGSNDIKFSYEGGIIGDASLALLADYPIKRESKKLAFLFKGFSENGDGNDSGCFVKFDCNGFTSLRIDGDIIISKDWVVPSDANGQIDQSGGRVRANLALTVTDMEDFVVETSMPYFKLAKDTSITFLVNKAVVDFSDTKSAVGFIPPPDYDPVSGEIVQSNAIDTLSELWKGVFFKQVEVILPSVFKQDNASLTIGAEDLYIDSKGISGNFYALDILPIREGKIGEIGWAFAIDRVGISMLYSQVFGFDFGGRIGLPINGESETFTYEASANLAAGAYNFNVGIDSTLSIPMWNVNEVKLRQGSKINVGVEKGEFKVQAVLNGNMNLSMNPNDENKSTDLQIADIVFDQLIVQDTLPYVTLGSNGGHISFLAGPVLNNSIINVDHATLSTLGTDKVIFVLGMEAGVMSEDDGGGKTAGEFGIVARPEFMSGRQSWHFDEMKLMALEVHLDFADAGYIKGGIEFFANDPIYGNGFSGYLEGGFVKDGNRYMFSAAASARFGTMNEGSDSEFKYWSFDVYVSSTEVSIPIYPPIAANGFGGGMYHHMRMAAYDLDAMADNGLTNPYSGLIYEPDIETRLGLKATIGLTTTSGKAFQGVVTLELSFNQNLGLREIKLYGTGEITGSDSDSWAGKQQSDISSNVLDEASAMTNNESAAASKTNTITCAIMLRISLIDGFTIHGAFNAYIDAGEGRITGKGTLDLFATSITNRWHLYIGGYSDGSLSNVEGDPIPPVSVSVDFSAFSITASLYLMMGNDLPGPPPLSPELASFFGESANNVNRARLNEGGRSTDNASGAAFGSSVQLAFRHYKTRNNGSINEKRFIDVNGGAGFDLALLSFSDVSRCSEADNFPQGQKGWRAYGRIFLYAQISGKWWLTIPTQYVGFIAEGDLPNPDFFDVQLKVKIARVININKRIELGEPCGSVTY